VTSVFERRGARLASRAFVVLCLAAAPAVAGSESDADARTAARALAAQGAQAFEQRDFAGALGLFERASAVISAPTIELMQARTLVELGRFVEAADAYEETQRLLVLDPSNEAFRQASDAARQELEQLLQRIPTLRVRVLGAAADERVEVRVDGKPLTAEQAALDRPSDPGDHHIEVRGAAGRVASRDVTLLERSHVDVEVTLEAAAPAVPKPVPTPAPVATSGGSTRTLGWVLGITGAAFTTAGAVTGIMALSDKAALDAVCKPGCPATEADTIDAWRRERTLSYVSFGLGAAGLAAGAYFVLSDRTPIGVAITPRRVALVGRFP
jgi:hypothetical protein